MNQTDLPPVASVAAIRRHFPALRRLHGQDPIAYFDGPGGTQVPTAVVDAMSDYLLHHNANTHWAFPTSVETDAIIFGARSALADFLNAAPNEIAFGANMTTLTFHLARALGRAYESRRRNRRDGIGSPRQCRSLACLGEGARRHGADGEDDSGNRTARSGRLRPATQFAHQTGRDRRRLQRSWHRSPTSDARPTWRTRWARRFSSMRCTMRRINWWTCARWTATFSAARRTNFMGRTSESSMDGTISSRRSISRNWCPRLMRRRNAPKPVRRITKGSRVPPLRSIFSPHSLRGRHDAHRWMRAFSKLHERGDELVRQLWDGLSEIEGVRSFRSVSGRAADADDRLHGRRRFVHRRSSAPGGPSALCFEWRLLRNHGGRAPGLGERRISPRRMRLLHDGGRSRAID